MPFVFDSTISVFLYLLFIFLAISGAYQYVKKRRDPETKVRSLIPLGALGLVLGFIGFFLKYRVAFEDIEAAGDISPQIVANSLGKAFDYPLLGLICLGLTYMFKYLNQVPK